MSEYTWGKIKFSEKVEKIHDFEYENIWVMFELEDGDSYEAQLHVSPLEENEIYFDILCEYHKYKHLGNH